MTQFFIGLLVGALVMDLLWAWKTGVAEYFIQHVRLKIKLWKAKKL
jgi:hypothetical protein